jgi:hypothetical protein
MRFEGTAWLAYGFPVTEHDEEELDEVLGKYDGLGHLTAGGFESKQLYLVAETKNADHRTPKALPMPIPGDQVAWDRQLAAAAKELGIDDHPTPQWLLIADISC